MKKRWTNILTAGLLLGVLALALQRVLRLSTDRFLHYYWILGGVAILLIFGFNIGRQVLFLRKQKKLLRILTDENDPDRFLFENQKLLAANKLPYNRAILYTNLCVGYCAKRNYAKAEEMLLAAPHQALRGIPLIVYRLDLTYVCFMLGKRERALELMEVYGETDFALVKSMPSLGGHVAVLHIFAAIETGRLDLAAELLAAAKTVWAGKGIEDDFAFLETRLAANR